MQGRTQRPEGRRHGRQPRVRVEWRARKPLVRAGYPGPPGPRPGPDPGVFRIPPPPPSLPALSARPAAHTSALSTLSLLTPAFSARLAAHPSPLSTSSCSLSLSLSLSHTQSTVSTSSCTRAGNDTHFLSHSSSGRPHARAHTRTRTHDAHTHYRSQTHITEHTDTHALPPRS